MKKTTEALKKIGVYDDIVKSVINTRKMTGIKNNSVNGIKNIIKMELYKHDDVFDVFFKEALNEVLDNIAHKIKSDAEKRYVENDNTQNFHKTDISDENDVIDKFIDFINAIAK